MLTRTLALLFWAHASFAGFSRGSTFDFVGLEGKIHLTCGNRPTTTQCAQTFMEPWPYDVFEGPKIPSATFVEITVQSARDTQTTIVDYDGETGKSSDINLGTYSLFSGPLLRLGKNNVQYSVFNDADRILKQGSFSVHVGRLPTRTCPVQKLSFPLAKDCLNTYSICQQYFRDLKYCR